jgi:hypothetical protein
MKIAVIGSGNVGGTLGRRWAENGHKVFFGARDAGSEKIKSLLASIQGPAYAVSVPEAIAAAPVVVLAIPWEAVQKTLEDAGDLTGKILVDCTNPLTFANGTLHLTLGLTTSGGEQVSVWAKGAQVVKSFNSTGWENMANPRYGDQVATMFLCGDGIDAKSIVIELIENLGFEACDIGDLTMARYLEPLAMIWILMGRMQGKGPDFSFKILRR